MVNNLGEFEIISFYDLTEQQQQQVIDNYDSVKDSSFFIVGEDIHDLSDYARTNTESEYDATCGITNTSAYAIKLSKCGTGVTLYLLY